MDQSFVTLQTDQHRIWSDAIEDLLNLKFGILCSRFLNERMDIPKSKAFRELLWILPDDDFKQELRMTKESFAYIRHEIESHPVFANQSNNPQEDVGIQMAEVFERFGTYGKGSSVGRVARSKGIGNGTVVLYTKRVVQAINDLSSKYLGWPNRENRREIANRFQEKYGIPGCVGLIDGTHVEFSCRPAVDDEVFFTRKHRYAMNVQLVCDEKKRINWYLLG
jgi:hypothetical protein